MPKVSVIIPNYNHAAYLNLRIDSVLNQTFQDFEVIILDDCSTDNSRAVIEQYRGHSKVSHIVFNETNSGTTFKQWKKGIALAKGEFIWLAESDDWCEPSFLETLVGGLLGNDNCVLAYAQSMIVKENNTIDNITSHHVLSEYLNDTDYIKQYLTDHNTICNASMALFKKECFYHIPDAYTTFKFCGDWLFWIEIAKQGDVFISGKVLNYFRKHGQDVTSKMIITGNNFIEELRIIKMLKADAVINDKEYKSQVLSLHIKYSFVKYQFLDDQNSAIKNSFYNDDSRLFKRFLIWNSNIFKLKYYIKKAVKRLINYK